jgi:hypothetical protein
MFLQRIRGAGSASATAVTGAAFVSAGATTAESWASIARAKAMKEKDIQDFLRESSKCCIATWAAHL